MIKPEDIRTDLVEEVDPTMEDYLNYLTPLVMANVTEFVITDELVATLLEEAASILEQSKE